MFKERKKNIKKMDTHALKKEKRGREGKRVKEKVYK